ncbi:MAG TPA: hypothetical protein VIY29_04490 [Ktedonobacteraceae bacterium]
MEYQLALSPDLGLSSADFVTAWNEAPDCRTAAEARLTSSSKGTYDPLLLAGIITLLSTVASGVLTNVISDLIKQRLEKKGVHKQVQVQQLEQPDGSHLLVVTIDEE